MRPVQTNAVFVLLSYLHLKPKNISRTITQAISIYVYEFQKPQKNQMQFEEICCSRVIWLYSRCIQKAQKKKYSALTKHQQEHRWNRFFNVPKLIFFIFMRTYMNCIGHAKLIFFIFSQAQKKTWHTHTHIHFLLRSKHRKVILFLLSKLSWQKDKLRWPRMK